MSLVSRSTLYRFLAWLGVALAGLWSFYPFIREPGLILFNDWHVHLFWAKSFTEALHQGIWYPRWLAQSNSGYGAPVFIYYAPLPYYTVGLVNLWFNDIGKSLQAVNGIGFIGSGITAYLLFRCYAARLPAALAAMAYATSPELLLYGYALNMPSTVFASLWIPLVFYAIHHLQGWQPYRMAGLAGVYALAIVSHILVGFQIGVIALLWLLLISLNPAERHRLKPIITALALGMLLAALYWLPMYLEKDLIHSEAEMGTGLRSWYTQLFLMAKPQWAAFRYAFPMMNQMNCTLALSLFTLIIAINYLSAPEVKARAKPALVFASFALFMMLPASYGVWWLVEFMQDMEFPWRWQQFFALWSLALWAIFMSNLPHQLQATPHLRKALIGAAIFSTLPLLFSFYYYSLPISSRTLVPYDADDGSNPGRFATESQMTWVLAASRWDPKEYRPMTAGPNWRRVLLEDKTPTLILKTGVGHFYDYTILNHYQSFQANVTETAEIHLKTFYFPSWQATLNSQPVALSPDPETGGIVLSVPPGQYLVELKFVDSPIRTYSRYLSLSTALLMALFLLAYTHRTRKRPALV